MKIGDKGIDVNGNEFEVLKEDVSFDPFMKYRETVYVVQYPSGQIVKIRPEHVVSYSNLVKMFSWKHLKSRMDWFRWLK